MQLKENQPLAPYCTFYIGGPCRYLIFAQDTEEVAEGVKFAKEHDLPIFIFGGGSNLLVADRGFAGVAMRIENVGMDIASETETTIDLKIASGEMWDDVVRFACEENWWGIENLSHIPGFSGGFAVQNVGAYGQEASSVIQRVEVLDLQDQSIKVLEAKDLEFSYRRSIFNTTHKNRYVILNTILRLSKIPKPNLSYGDLAEQFGDTTPSILELREAVIKIRNRKFPFPDSPTKGNCGSFFRGPILSLEEFHNLEEALKNKFGEQAAARLQKMKSHLQVAQGLKTPTAFLIELCLGKQLSVGGAYLNPNQPAIILNHTGHATAQDVLTLFKQVQAQVLDQTAIHLEAEPELLGFNESELLGLKLEPTNDIL
jgi:UDP-N-acetylmuramate dehydrogenase